MALFVMLKSQNPRLHSKGQDRPSSSTVPVPVYL